MPKYRRRSRRRTRPATARNTAGQIRIPGAPLRRRGESSAVPQRLWREARLATARRALGVSKGAGVEEISAAYRKLARTHHPDKVANLEPEVRDYSEQRMKEINAAYASFKRHWNDQATEGARAG